MKYGQRGRKLNYSALLGMNNAKVVVHDLREDIYDQVCLVKVLFDSKKKGKKWVNIPQNVTLENEEFVYNFDFDGVKGSWESKDFEVFALEGKNE